jgi:putative transposase
VFRRAPIPTGPSSDGATRKAYRYRLYPNKGQEGALAVQFGHARWTYNWGLRTRQEHYRAHHASLSFFALKQQLPSLKKLPDTEWLRQADSQALQAKLEDLDRAYTNFFEGRASYPRLKSKKDRQSIRYPQRFRLEPTARRIYLPKVGYVRCVFHRAWEGTPKNVTVSKTKSGEFYASVQCELVRSTSPSQLPSQLSDQTTATTSIGTSTSTGKPSVGVDLGLKHFAVLHTGEVVGGVEKVEHPKYMRKAEKRLKRLHRDLSSKQKGSHNRNRARVRLARGYEHVARQRADFLHKLSTRLVREHSLVKLENLNVCGMVRNHSLAKSISDSGWGMFGRMCEYKGGWYGCLVERVDRFYPSSKTCSQCGWVNDKLELNHRFWVCLGCGAEHDRDANAALNLLHAPSLQSAQSRKEDTGGGRKGSQSTAGAAGTHARGDHVRRSGFQALRGGRRSERPISLRIG